MWIHANGWRRCRRLRRARTLSRSTQEAANGFRTRAKQSRHLINEVVLLNWIRNARQDLKHFVGGGPLPLRRIELMSTPQPLQDEVYNWDRILNQARPGARIAPNQLVGILGSRDGQHLELDPSPGRRALLTPTRTDYGLEPHAQRL